MYFLFFFTWFHSKIGNDMFFKYRISRKKKTALNAYNTCASIAKVENLHTANVVEIIVFV